MTDDADDHADNDRRLLLLGDDDVIIDRSIEPGSPRPEHALFVLLGAASTILVFLDGIGLL